MSCEGWGTRVVMREDDEGDGGEGDEEDGDDGGGVEDLVVVGRGVGGPAVVWWKRKLSWMRRPGRMAMLIWT